MSETITETVTEIVKSIVAEVLPGAGAVDHKELPTDDPNFPHDLDPVIRGEPIERKPSATNEKGEH
jgi:hypothetical protein